MALTTETPHFGLGAKCYSEAEKLWGVPRLRCLHRAGNSCSSKNLAHLGEGVLDQHWPEYKQYTYKSLVRSRKLT